MTLKHKFDTKYGVVSLSSSFAKLGCDKPQTDITYKPNNYNDWGITRTVNTIEVQDFTRADAEFFACVAEEKLRISRPNDRAIHYHRSCKHGVILYGNECLSCKREGGVIA